MKVEIKKTEDGHYVAFVIVNSGKRYSYSCLLYSEPSETQIISLWQESRKHWSRCI